MLILATVLIAIQQKSQPLASFSGAQILKRMNAAVRAGSPVAGKMVTSGPSGQVESVEFAIMYPGLMVSKSTQLGMHIETYLNSSGDYSYNRERNEVTMWAGLRMENRGIYGMEGLFGDKQDFEVADKVGLTTFIRRNAYAVSTETPSFGWQWSAHNDTIFVDAKTFLPLGFDESDPVSGVVEHTIYKQLKWKARLTKKSFKWKPPKGANILVAAP